jgi:GT2 family glycosyltransferase
MSNAGVRSPDVSILIVSYQCERYLAGCVRSIYEQLRDVRFEIIVVDNASSDGTARFARETEFPFQWIPLTNNVGFGRANNIAAQHAKGRYLLLLNPDTELLADCVTPLMAYLEAHPDTGLIGGYHEDWQGRWQRSFGAPVRLRDEYAYAMRLPGRTSFEDFGVAPTEPVPVGWLAGSFLMMPRKIVGQSGIFDPDFFLNDEDIDLARRVMSSGLQVIFHPVRGLRHFGGASKVHRGSPHRDHFTSRYAYYRKHHGALHAAGFVLCHWLQRLRDYASLLLGNERRNEWKDVPLGPEPAVVAPPERRRADHPH